MATKKEKRGNSGGNNSNRFHDEKIETIAKETVVETTLETMVEIEIAAKTMKTAVETTKTKGKGDCSNLKQNPADKPLKDWFDDVMKEKPKEIEAISELLRKTKDAPLKVSENSTAKPITKELSAKKKTIEDFGNKAIQTLDLSLLSIKITGAPNINNTMLLIGEHPILHITHYDRQQEQGSPLQIPNINTSKEKRIVQYSSLFTPRIRSLGQLQMRRIKIQPWEIKRTLKTQRD